MISKVSIIIPYHDMKNGAFFLKRNIDSIMAQTFKDYEIVLTKDGGMAHNTNAAIKRARGEIIKILYLDDRLAHKDSLKVIVDNFKGGWLATGCLHDDGISIGAPHFPEWNENVGKGVNTIGSPSVIAIENNSLLLFDEQMSWLLDCDYYKRLYEQYGEPTLLNDLNVIIGTGRHQMTYILTDQEKLNEHNYLTKKYE